MTAPVPRTLREDLAALAECVAGWEAEGLGSVPGLERTNWPDMWGDVRAHVAALAARAADRDAGLREEVARLRGWLREATEAEWSEPCRLDHHGGCQNHGYLDGPCLIPTVRDYFAALDPPAGNPTGGDPGGTDE